MLILADSGSGGTPATTRFAVNQIRTLLAGGRAVADDAGWTSEAFLRFDAGPVPLYLGAMSPRMLALAGECADGVLPLLYPPEHYPTAAEQVLDGARAAGRDPDDIDLAACIWVSVDRDEARARRPLAEKIAYYGASFAPYLLHRAGLSAADFEPIQAALRADGIDGAVDLVTDRMLALGIAGTPEQVVARSQGLIAMGARHVSFGPPLGPDVLGAVDSLGREVLPALRG